MKANLNDAVKRSGSRAGGGSRSGGLRGSGSRAGGLGL